jgi:hypothetical protein
MTHTTKVAVLLVLLIALPAHAGRGGYGGGGGRGGGHGHGGWGHGGGWHGHGHGHFHGGFYGPSIFIGGYWDPFWPRYYSYPYYYPYYPYPGPYSYPAYPPSAETDDRYARDEERDPPRNDASAEDARRATYGLMQFRGIPDGAQIDLDDRFWLDAQGLDQRWLAIPDGRHTITVRVDGNDPVTRDIEVRAGAKQVIKFGPFRKG